VSRRPCKTFSKTVVHGSWYRALAPWTMEFFSL